MRERMFAGWRQIHGDNLATDAAGMKQGFSRDGFPAWSGGAGGLNVSGEIYGKELLAGETGAGDVCVAAFVKDGQRGVDGSEKLHGAEQPAGDEEGRPGVYYHSVSEKQVVGLARVEKEAYPDPTATEGDGRRWIWRR